MRLPLASSALVHALVIATFLQRRTPHPTTGGAEFDVDLEDRNLAGAPTNLVEPIEATPNPPEDGDAARVAPDEPRRGGEGHAPIGHNAPDLLEQIQEQIGSWDGYLVPPVHTSATNKWAPDEFLSGRVPRSYIERAVNAQKHAILLCHGAGGPSSLRLSGDVRVAFVIDGRGQVTRAQDAGGSFADAAVRRCIADAFRKLSFAWPPNGVPQTLTYTIPLVGESGPAHDR
jgi:hypothetical protein